MWNGKIEPWEMNEERSEAEDQAGAKMSTELENANHKKA